VTSPVAAPAERSSPAVACSKRETPLYSLSTAVDFEPALMWLGEQNALRPVAKRILATVLTSSSDFTPTLTVNHPRAAASSPPACGAIYAAAARVAP
jgi:hypothetical protein